ncbi:MAG: dihydrolipoyl dehydrogenase [Acidimicrobiia bacterium]|nr:dihydrolipoyl dehydrogenase [Acidimicrobiia bacterium]
MPDRFDVAVVGAGPGGYAAALYGAATGLQVALVEADKVGGTCLNRGCIPAKELLQTADVLRTVGDAGEFGVTVAAHELDWTQVLSRQSAVVDRLVKGVSGLLKGRNVTVLSGRGHVAAPDTVDVDGTRIEADAIVVATGSTPSSIPGFEIDGGTVVSSDHALFLDELPESVAIVGAGVIGCEFASAFVDMGVDVLVLELMPTALGSADEEISTQLVNQLRRRGADIRLGAKVLGHTEAATPGMRTVSFEHGGEGLEADVELILVAVGRRPAGAGLGLEELGVGVTDRGHVEVDTANMRTAVPGVYAVGDVVDTPALAHVGYAEAMVAIRDILGEDPRGVVYDRVPWCVYTHPEVAWCGLTEEAARAQGYEVEVTKHNYAGVARAVILGETRGFVKVVADAVTGQLLGFHIVGPWATEQLTEGYLATNWEATVGELGHLVHAHPTLGEAIGETALSMTGRGLHG